MELTLKKGAEKRTDRREAGRLKRNVTLQASRIEYPFRNTTPVQAKTIDLSNKGVLFCGDTSYEVDSLLQVSLTLPGWTRHHPGFINPMEDSLGRPFTAVAKVKRCEPSSDQFYVAVEFVNVDTDDMIGLNGYLNKQIAGISQN